MAIAIAEPCPLPLDAVVDQDAPPGNILPMLAGLLLAIVEDDLRHQAGPDNTPDDDRS